MDEWTDKNALDIEDITEKRCKKIVVIVVVVNGEEAKIFKKKLGIGIRMP